MNKFLLMMALTTSLVLNKTQITPEWITPKGLVLVYPNGLRSSLTPFYMGLIKKITTKTELNELTLIVLPEAKTEIEDYCKQLNTKTRFRFFTTNSVKDVWARDFCPIYFSNDTVCKALYNPSYFNEKEIIKYADPDNQVGLELAKFLNLKVTFFIESGKSNLILDGGNFIQNGQGTAIVTNRVITDNETRSIEEIKEIFKSKLNISKLIFVPVEPGDETGHIDGMVRFASANTVFIASYPDKYENGDYNIKESDYKTSKLFLDNLAETLSKTFKVIRIENAIPKDDRKFPSAFGNYINFLRIGDAIFLPQYGIIQDSKAKEKINEIKTVFPDLKIITISQDIEKLSKFGGVLNCISWTYY